EGNIPLDDAPGLRGDATLRACFCRRRGLRRLLPRWRCREGARRRLDQPGGWPGLPLCWSEDAPDGEENSADEEGEEGAGSPVGESRASASAIFWRPHALA